MSSCAERLLFAVAVAAVLSPNLGIHVADDDVGQVQHGLREFLATDDDEMVMNVASQLFDVNEADTKKPKKTQKTKATTRASHDHDNVTNGTDMSLVEAQPPRALWEGASLVESQGFCNAEIKHKVDCLEGAGCDIGDDTCQDACAKKECCFNKTEAPTCFVPLPAGSMPDYRRLMPLHEDRADWQDLDRDRRASGEKQKCLAMDCKAWDFDCEHFVHREGAKFIRCHGQKCTTEDFDTCCELVGKEPARPEAPCPDNTTKPDPQGCVGPWCFMDDAAIADQKTAVPAGTAADDLPVAKDEDEKEADTAELGAENGPEFVIKELGPAWGDKIGNSV